MPLRAGERRGGGRSLCFLILLNVLFSAGVTAIQEENKVIHEEKPAELQKATTGHAPGPAVSVDELNKGNLGFIHAFVAALSVIIVSELGDKTFFIAAIMAMRYNRLTVLAGAMLALGLMTCLSVLFGYATTIIPRIYTYYISTALFAIFGVRMLREGLKMSADEGQEELEEVQAEIKKKDEELQRYKLANGSSDVEAGTAATISSQRRVGRPLSACHYCAGCKRGSIWSSSWGNIGTLSVHRPGCYRRKDGGSKDLRKNRYNHWWNRFPGLCVLCPLYQARFWILMEKLTLGFILYVYNPEQVEQRETAQRPQTACLYV
uniref:GDT1 family protein n=1 Tax=Cyprinus carpio carpio TaxID=630221 RepID=A0A9J8BKE7_CYPCA